MVRNATPEELGEYVCNVCNNFDLDDERCKKGYRPQRYILDEGPNEECHFRNQCKDFDKYQSTEDDLRAGVEQAIGRYFAV